MRRVRKPSKGIAPRSKDQYLTAVRAQVSIRRLRGKVHWQGDLSCSRSSRELS